MRSIQSNYYAFGSPMAGRTHSQSLYRFGFNGKENDSETYGTGNALDFGARIYDSRLGRWLSVDPLAGKYCWYSPYIFAGNKPMWFIDKNGAEEIMSIGPGDPINVYIVVVTSAELKADYRNTTTGAAMGTFTFIVATDIESANLQLQQFLNGRKADNIILDIHGMSYSSGPANQRGLSTSLSNYDPDLKTRPEENISSQEIKEFNEGVLDTSTKEGAEANKDIVALQSIFNAVKDGGTFVNYGCEIADDKVLIKNLQDLSGNRLTMYMNMDPTTVWYGTKETENIGVPQIWTGGQSLTFSPDCSGADCAIQGWVKTVPSGEQTVLKRGISLDSRKGKPVVTEITK